MKKIIPLIVSGGQGTRLWPLSRASMPKQFIPLVNGESLFGLTVDRIQDDIFLSPVVVCAKEHRFRIIDLLKEKRIQNPLIICETIPRNTTAAFCAGALSALLHGHSPDTQILILPSDHLIPDKAAFIESVKDASNDAEDTGIITFGITPTLPHTGYGYIEKGEKSLVAYKIKSFKEKPDQPTAVSYIQAGYLWNAGIFLSRLDFLIDAIETHSTETFLAVHKAVRDGVEDLGNLILDEKALEEVSNVPFDISVMEKTDNSFVIPACFEWNDLGSWDALWDIADKDTNDNALIGNAVCAQGYGNYIRSDNKLLCTVGIENIIAVEAGDAVLIMPRGRSEMISELIRIMKSQNMTQLLYDNKIYRPWGHYEILLEQPFIKVLKVVLLPKHRFSLHRHQKRNEHWTVVKGKGVVIKDGTKTVLSQYDTMMIPIGCSHRFENNSDSEIEIIEVQSGAYLGIDDIERLDDDYNRFVNTEQKRGLQ